MKIWLVFLSLLVFLEAYSLDTQVTPVARVVKLLKDMKETGQKEKQAEKVQYAAYEQFCTSTLGEKKRTIESNQEKQDILKADVQKLTSDIQDLAAKIKESNVQLESWEASKENATKVRTDEHEGYAEAHAEYTKAIGNVGKAIETLKNEDYTRKQEGSFLQLSSVLQSAPSDMSFDARRAIEAFIAESSSVETGSSNRQPEAAGYEFQSGQILDLLEELLGKFKDERTDLEKGEVSKKHSYEMLMQDWESQVGTAVKTRDDRTAEKARKEQKKAEKSTESTRLANLIQDDTKYRNDLNVTCAQKKDDFQERQTTRAEEIAAIDKATQVIEDKLLNKQSFIQTKQAGTSLASFRSDVRGITKERAISLLRERAEALNSRTLSALAVRAEGDGLSKVRKMISDLIARMQEEALADADKAGWCSKELATNKQTRTTKTQQLETLQGEVSTLKTDIEELGRDITDLSKEITKLNADRSEATKLRTDEKAENNATVQDAKHAQEAVAEAMAALSEFYGGAAASFVQQSAKSFEDPEAPEIFGDSSYTGMASGGVESLLEVIQADYAHLEAETEAAEAKSLAEFNEFMSDSGADKAAKEKEVELKQGTKTSKSNALSDKKIDVSDVHKALAAANEYYEELKPECSNPGLSRAVKIEKRKQEIESLRDVLEVLESR